MKTFGTSKAFFHPFARCHTHSLCLLWLLSWLEPNSNTKACKQPSAGADLGTWLQDLRCLMWDVQSWLYERVALKSPSAFTWEPGNRVIHGHISSRKEGRNKLAVGCVIYSRKFCSFSLLRQNKQNRQQHQQKTKQNKTKKTTTEPYLLLDAFFMPLDHCLGWSSILCLQLNCGHKTFHH